MRCDAMPVQVVTPEEIDLGPERVDLPPILHDQAPQPTPFGLFEGGGSQYYNCCYRHSQ